MGNSPCHFCSVITDRNQYTYRICQKSSYVWGITHSTHKIKSGSIHCRRTIHTLASSSLTPNQYGLDQCFGTWLEKRVIVGRSVLCHMLTAMSNDDCRSYLTQQTVEVSGMFSGLDGCSESLHVCHISNISHLLFLLVIV